MGLRDRLRSRQLPQATVGIRVDWSEESYEILQAADIAENAVRVLGDDPDADGEMLLARATEKRAKADALYEAVTIKAIPAAEFEELVNAHQPTADQQKQGLAFDRTTFFPALLAVCVEGPETETDWTEMIGSGELVMGELNTLIGVAMQLNDRSPSVTLGKGSTTTTS